MRIVHLSYNIPRYLHSDPEVWLQHIGHSVGILESMSNHAEVIAIYNTHYKGILHKKNITYHFPNYSRWQLNLPYHLNRYVKKLAPDVVIVHGLIFPLQVIMLRWQLGNKIKITVQHHAERPLKGIRSFIQRFADRYIQIYFFCSLDLGKQWVEKNLVKVEKIEEVMEASSVFKPIERVYAKTFSKISGQSIFLWVGGLHARKDPLLVVKSFIRFAKTHPGVKLYMIYQSDEMLNEVRSAIDEASAYDTIFLIGKVDHNEISYWFASADFIISTSHYEGSGVAVCEAMSCGCIPVLSNLPSFRMMTKNGNIGALFEPGDEEGLINKLKNIMRVDREIERSKVLRQFDKELSFQAISTKMLKAIRES